MPACLSPTFPSPRTPRTAFMTTAQPDPWTLPPRARDASRLRELLKILQCPVTRRPLIWQEDGFVITDDGSYRWPVESLRPVLHPTLEKVADQTDHVSHHICAEAQKVLDETDGIVLHLSAGGTRRWSQNVVEAETAIFRNTDVVVDVHSLPFVDHAFSAVVALNAFEHFRNPFLAAKEITRVLKPGGQLFIHTAFLQPLHDNPYHFCNATKYGLLEWFPDLVTESLRVSENFNPFFVFAWLAHELDARLQAHLPKEEATPIMNLSLAKLAEIYRSPGLWQHPMRRSLATLPQEAQQGLAAGFEYVARRREISSAQ